MSFVEGAKLIGGVLRDNKDVITHVTKVSADEVSKHKNKNAAKERYGDYLAYRSSGVKDVEQFAYERAQTSGRDWNTILENITFHIKKNGGFLLEAEKPEEPKCLPDTSAISAQKLWSAGKTGGDWKQLQERVRLRLVLNNAPEDLIEYLEALTEFPVEEDKQLSIYGYAFIDGYTEDIKELSEKIFRLFPDMIGSEYRYMKEPLGALLLAYNQIRGNL